MVSVKLEWVVVEKKVYNVDTQKTEFIRFLRLNIIHKYNHTMGHVDVADQLRGSYRIDIYVRNRKWWWAIMFWAFGTLLTNAYVVYINRIPVMAPILAPLFGVHFLRGRIFLKNRSYRPLLRASTSLFNGTCLLIKLKEVKVALYGPHLQR
jgi:hypothetical protein